MEIWIFVSNCAPSAFSLKNAVFKTEGTTMQFFWSNDFAPSKIRTKSRRHNLRRCDVRYEFFYKQREKKLDWESSCTSVVSASCVFGVRGQAKCPNQRYIPSGLQLSTR